MASGALPLKDTIEMHRHLMGCLLWKQPSMQNKLHPGIRIGVRYNFDGFEDFARSFSRSIKQNPDMCKMPGKNRRIVDHGSGTSARGDQLKNSKCICSGILDDVLMNHGIT